MSLQALVVYIAGAFFALYGVAFALLPNTMLPLVTDSVVMGASAIVDIRATYGGMTIAVGLVILYLHAVDQTRSSLMVITIVLLSMAITRSIGLVLDGATNSTMYIYLVLEAAGALLSFAVLRRSSSAT